MPTTLPYHVTIWSKCRVPTPKWCKVGWTNELGSNEDIALLPVEQTCFGEHRHRQPAIYGLQSATQSTVFHEDQYSSAGRSIRATVVEVQEPRPIRGRFVTWEAR